LIHIFPEVAANLFSRTVPDFCQHYPKPPALIDFYLSQLLFVQVCWLFSASPVIVLAWVTIERSFCGFIPAILDNPFSSAAATLAIVS
jgi:hypothetical protein